MLIHFPTKLKVCSKSLLQDFEDLCHVGLVIKEAYEAGYETINDLVLWVANPVHPFFEGFVVGLLVQLQESLVEVLHRLVKLL